jgi:hypothetical protein
MGLWMIWASYKSTVSHTTVGQFLWIFSDVLVALNLVNILRHSNYLEFADNKIIIHKDFFRTKVIDVDVIDQVIIEPGPFKYSKILLKDKTEVKINDSYADGKDMKEFMEQLKILIV